MLNRQRLFGIALAATTALAASTAQAAFVWNFGGSGGKLSGAATTFNASFGGKTVTASVTAWADSGAVGDGGTNRVLNQGNVYQYSGGLGVQWVAPAGTTINGLSQESTGVPEHTMDNCGLLNSFGTCTAGTPEDFILFKFSDSVALSQVAQGWFQTDADITVLAYTGAGDPTANLTKDTYASTDAAGGLSTGLVNDGWTWVGNYADLQNGAATINTGANTGGQAITSSYWLIGAYNSRVHAEATTWDSNNDFLKITSLAGTVTPPGGKVPEPASAALVLLGLAAARRYRPRRG
jgi:MYXO-CTERM domain-containing protein